MKPYYQSDSATVYCADVLEALREMPDESVQCDSSIQLACVDSFYRLVQLFTIGKNFFAHRSPWAVFLPALLGLLIFSEGDYGGRLQGLLNEMGFHRENQIGSHAIGRTVNIHYFLTLESARALINARLSVEGAAELSLNQLEHAEARHAYLDSFVIRRTVNIRAVSHSPRRFFNAHIGFAINDSGDIGDSFFLGHILSIPQDRGEVQNVNMREVRAGQQALF